MCVYVTYVPSCQYATIESGAKFAKIEVNPKLFLYNELSFVREEFNDST